MIKRVFLLFLCTFSLSMYIDISAAEPSLVETTVSSNKITSQSVKSIKCREHDWEYCTRTSGSIVYYNYRCIYCSTYRYSPWKRK